MPRSNAIHEPVTRELILRRIAAMPAEDLRTLVTRLADISFLDVAGDRPVYNPEKEISGSDYIDRVAGLLETWSLYPDHLEECSFEDPEQAEAIPSLFPESLS